MNVIHKINRLSHNVLKVLLIQEETRIETSKYVNTWSHLSGFIFAALGDYSQSFCLQERYACRTSIDAQHITRARKDGGYLNSL